MWTNFCRRLDGVSSHLGRADAPLMNGNSGGDGDGRGAADGAAAAAHLDVRGVRACGKGRGAERCSGWTERPGKLVSTRTAPRLGSVQAARKETGLERGLSPSALSFPPLPSPRALFWCLLGTSPAFFV